MPALADSPEIIGFFSYSREDDDAFKGTLSALREAIQRELSAQLGRSKKTFRLWQDQEAIAPGRLWETEIKSAVEQSVFFIPLVTPRMVNSNHCQFEFDSFIARERALGRTDLVFPILYIAVPALENEAQWRNHPVLSFVGRRQYVDWRQFRHHDVNTTVVREAIERFCQKIVAALNEQWLTPEERQRQEELQARAREENERLRREEDAKRRADAETLRQKAESEARRVAEDQRTVAAEAERRAQDALSQAETVRRAEEDLRVREARARRRLREEEALAAAKNADAIPEIDAFLTAHPNGYFAADAKAFRESLVMREQAFREIANRYDAGVLTAFLDRYPSGKRADEIRQRLRVLQMQSKGGLILPIILGTLVFLAVLGAVLISSGALMR